MKRLLAIGIVLLTGLTVLGGYIIPQSLGPILGLLIDWGIILIGAAGLVGIGYLISKHIGILVKRNKRSFLSVVLLLAFLFTLVFGLVLSIQHPSFIDLIFNIQIPVETSLLAILAVILMAASFRLISTRGWTPMSISFLISAIFSLAVNIGVFNVVTGSIGTAVLSLLNRLPLIGARGILLGIALGGLIVGLRVLLTIDKPYGE
jgi:hypothetical protein